MTEKEIAEKLRSMATLEHTLPHQLREIADELDPPPKPGTVVWWKYDEFEKWELGIAGENGIAIEGGSEVGWEEHGLQWKPARILTEAMRMEAEDE